MEGSAIDVVVFAPLAPIFGVLLFWFIQLLFIESQKYFLSIIRPKHEPLCRFTNFLGILFQTICHALGYTVTKHGISDFYVSIHYGKVKPKKEKKGIFEWLANSFLFLGPFFIPALLLLICLFFLVQNGFNLSTAPDYTFAGQMIAFGSNLHAFTTSFLDFLLNINLLHPGHFGFLLLMIFLGLGMRPSYFGEKTRRKVDMLYDLANIKNNILHKPLYVLLLFLTAYLFFYISFWLGQNWYSALFSIFGWLSIISIVSLIITHLIILFIMTTDKINSRKKFLPYFLMPISYILMRVLFYYFPTNYTNSASLFVMIFVTFFITLYLLKPKTNKLKSKRDIKMFKKKKKGEDDDPGRTIKK